MKKNVICGFRICCENDPSSEGRKIGEQGNRVKCAHETCVCKIGYVRKAYLFQMPKSPFAEYTHLQSKELNPLTYFN